MDRFPEKQAAGSLGDKLENVLGNTRPQGGEDSLRWSVEVPIVTNPFILVDFLRFCLITAMIVFVMAAIPQWAYARGIAAPQLAAILRLCGWGALVFAACLFVVGFFLLQNRFHALFVLNDRQIYYETIKKSKRSFLKFNLKWRPTPADDSFDPDAVRSFTKEVPWSKADSFIAFPAVRTILLKRGIWEILKLYMPDDATYAQVEAFLGKRLKQRNP